ncbi:MAG: GNAT family N-acetyltransferase [Candidatus Sericytochromatia bacterium]
MILHTARLRLRNWRESDFEPFAEMCADPEVMRFFPAVLSRAESLEMAQKIKSLLEARGWGWWAVEIPGVTDFAGFVGLHIPKDSLPFSPCVEIGWRLAQAHWGRGYATEAARAALDFGFHSLDLEEIVSFTAVVNQPSIAVMQKLGMRHTGFDFDHPDLDAASPLRRHVLYKMAKADWLSASRAPARSS